MAVFAGSIYMYIQTWGPLQLMYDNCVLNCKERERERESLAS